jgi:hypothetical protein
MTHTTNTDMFIDEGQRTGFVRLHKADNGDRVVMKAYHDRERKAYVANLEIQEWNCDHYVTRIHIFQNNPNYKIVDAVQVPRHSAKRFDEFCMVVLEKAQGMLAEFLEANGMAQATCDTCNATSESGWGDTELCLDCEHESRVCVDHQRTFDDECSLCVRGLPETVA